VGGQGGVDALGDQLADLFGDLASEFEGADVAQRVGPVGVADDQPALGGIARQVEGGAGQLLAVLGRDQEGEVVDLPTDVVLLGGTDLQEGQVVDVVDALGTGDRNAQGQPGGIVVLVPDFEDLGERCFGDGHHLVDPLIGIGVSFTHARILPVSPGPTSKRPTGSR